MKQVVTVRNLTIGEGVPKICVPIVATTEEEIMKKAEEIMQYPADLIEWRADYFALNLAVAMYGEVDLIDLEIYHDLDRAKNVISMLHEAGIKVVASHHDFDKTPSRSEIMTKLSKMVELDADILKIAVMPNEIGDVARLLKIRMYAIRPRMPYQCVQDSGLRSFSVSIRLLLLYYSTKKNKSKEGEHSSPSFL